MRRARRLFPGGVSSPVRAFKSVGGEPFVVESGKGARIRDVDGREYIDFVLSWGALPLGHAHDSVVSELERVLRRGTSFGIPTELEVQLAELITRRMPHIEMLRFVSSGTEATMSAVRLARAATGRDHVLKFEGCYHGHADSFLVRAGSGVATLGLPDSPGVPSSLASLTLTCAFNDPEQLERTIGANADNIAAVIVEPVIGNAGFIAPVNGFLSHLRNECDRIGALLIFDEVMTGFRVAPGGAAERFGVTPDITTLGKVIGGGLPVAAYGAITPLMRRIAPDGPVYQAGTLSGNPLSMAAGIATLSALTREVHGLIEERTERLVGGFRAAAARLGVPLQADSCGSMWGFFFNAEPVRSFGDAKKSDVEFFRRFFMAALERGVYLAPSAYEAGFMSAAHDDAVIDESLRIIGEAMHAATQQE
jgi:glutamate-1-semialdehyde 2,1-aminomutase